MAKTLPTAKTSPQIHNIPPVWDARSQILVLGSFPSVKSREAQFFYGHPQNRFWRVLSGVLDQPVPETIPQKKEFLLENHIAVWDVIASCEIEGSSDSTIRNVVPNDLAHILDHAPIAQIYCNGAKSYDLYRKYCQPCSGRPAVKLPSTSPANAAYSLSRLLESWQVIKK
ncbi:DNA-deoxyinosine glycosylase [Anaerovorax odorimutans]|uniref:DNA-deoxyinosine glycosylase n=1 Tax=Anaerovorax odorimutans TaxID=109327 RepID=A0ABT1RSH1_9FIRM|nr:DNA-deoxyinosine glycosylase [Anaerovorax odorimutans]MCQ4638101.1 DNA-deoxyinosine glycosylase [Anaerovorax odorimutans]